MGPRLLTDRAVAEYLALPLSSARKLLAGRVIVSGRVRWDLRAIDAWLDGLRGVKPDGPANSNMSGPDAALADFLAGSPDASRRS